MMTSQGGVKESQPQVLGMYELENYLMNDRIVYKNTESELYLFSIEIDNEQYDGSWMVCRVY